MLSDNVSHWPHDPLSQFESTMQSFPATANRRLAHWRPEPMGRARWESYRPCWKTTG
ncbi:hypothetical protein CT19431_MP60012 [Cupriavidus taiwanensis]|nr:hypothetical protein CT19431_MP60012 [Cupriavidus taiwanensis]